MNHTSSSSNHKTVVWICLALVALIWLVFGQALSFDFVNYDDNSYVYENPLVQNGITLDGIVRVFTRDNYSFYHPLTTLSHMLDHQIYGMNPTGFHATNLLLHTASALLLFLVLRAMTGSLWRSAFVAALFAIHPLRAESVVWITERKDTLSGLFFMLTLAAYANYQRHIFSKSRYGLVLACMTAAMLSKAILVTLPFILLLLDFWPLKRQVAWKKLLVEKMPFLLLSAGICWITILSSKGSIYSMEQMSFGSRIGNALTSYTTYIIQSLHPFNLAAFYPHPLNGIPLWKSGLALISLILISIGVLRNVREKPYLLTGWFWYLGMLLPVIGIIQAGQQAHADRYTYLSQIGLSIMVTWLIVDGCSSLSFRKPLLSTTAALILGALAITAHHQASYWENSLSLWTHALDCTQKNYLAHSNLGSALSKLGQKEKAIEQFEMALRIQPNAPEAHHNLGVSCIAHGNLKQALWHFEKALESNPELIETRYMAGSVCSYQGLFEQATSHFEIALQTAPNHSGIKNNLAWILATCPKEKFRNGPRAIELVSSLPMPSGKDAILPLETLAAAYAECGQYKEAVSTAQYALEIGETYQADLTEIRECLRQYESGHPYRTPEKQP